MSRSSNIAFQLCLPLRATRLDTKFHFPIDPRNAPRSVARCSMRPFLDILLQRRSLNPGQAVEAAQYTLSGDASDAEIGAFLALLSVKGETAAEIGGIVNVLHDRMIPVNAPCDVLDIVGTGGDGFNTINISTAASILAAAAGCKIAKHGNRSVSSKSGSADVLEALGVNLSLSSEKIVKCIDQVGIAFMFARNHHPSMKYVSNIRSSLKIRTIFNIVGPLLSPCDAKYIVLGVYTAGLLDIMADVLISSGVKRAVVVNTAGMDEYSNTGISEVIEIEDGVKTKTTFDPVEELGMPRVDVKMLKGGDASENAAVIRSVLSGDLQGPITDAIVLNAGVGCYIYGLDSSIKEGVQRVRDVLASGEGIETLEKWVRLSHSFSPA